MSFCLLKEVHATLFGFFFGYLNNLILDRIILPRIVYVGKKCNAQALNFPILGFNNSWPRCVRRKVPSTWGRPTTNAETAISCIVQEIGKTFIFSHSCQWKRRWLCLRSSCWRTAAATTTTVATTRNFNSQTDNASTADTAAGSRCLPPSNIFVHSNIAKGHEEKYHWIFQSTHLDLNILTSGSSIYILRHSNTIIVITQKLLPCVLLYWCGIFFKL